MPNNFGGDQQDPDYAPHLNDRKVPRTPEETEDWLEAGPFVPPKPVDRRVRSYAQGFRVVVPEGSQKGKKFYVNNSPVVVEKRSRDATGAEKWDRIESFPKPDAKGDHYTDTDRALYWLLAGPDAE